jgi:hypothetical protein
MPRADGTLNAREKAADIWQQQHWVDADGDPAINRVQSYPGTYVREPSAMLRGNFSLSSFGTPEEVIWWAAHENECDILMSLALDRRLDINWRNEHGCSAFYIAVVKGHIDAVQTLLGLNRDDFDYDLVCPRALDASPFWAAARAGDAAMIKVLLEESPCDFEKANKHGIAPVEAAREAGHDDVVLLIERRKRKLAGVADWPSYKPPSREKLPSIPAVRPPLSTECDPGMRLRRERKSIDELDADREANGWVCKVCGRRNAASDFREPLCRVCKVVRGVLLFSVIFARRGDGFGIRHRRGPTITSRRWCPGVSCSPSTHRCRPTTTAATRPPRSGAASSAARTSTRRGGRSGASRRCASGTNCDNVLRGKVYPLDALERRERVRRVRGARAL